MPRLTSPPRADESALVSSTHHPRVLAHFALSPHTYDPVAERFHFADPKELFASAEPSRQEKPELVNR